jgi:hypothetical protein
MNLTDLGAAPSATAGPKNLYTMAQADRLRWAHVRYAFFSGGPLAFKVEIEPEDNAPTQNLITYLFEWSGNWKLTRIILPSDAIDRLPTAASNQSDGSAQLSRTSPSSLIPSTTPAVPKQPAPLKMTLTKKGFKDKNIQAGDFEDDITFQLLIENDTGEDIRAFDGVLAFVDLKH